MAVDTVRPFLKLETSVDHTPHETVNGTPGDILGAGASSKADLVTFQGEQRPSGTYGQDALLDTPPPSPAAGQGKESLIHRKPVHSTAELTPPQSPIELDSFVRPENLPELPPKSSKPYYVPEERPLLPPRPSRADLSGASYDLGPAMESGLPPDVVEVIASGDLTRITSMIQTREHMLKAAKVKRGELQAFSENPDHDPRFRKAEEIILREEANLKELGKAVSANTPWYRKVGNGFGAVMRNPAGQLGVSMVLPSAIEAAMSHFSGNKNSEASQASPSNGGAAAGQGAPQFGPNTPLTAAQAQYLTAGIPEFGGSMPTMPGAFPGGPPGGFNSTLPYS